MNMFTVSSHKKYFNSKRRSNRIIYNMPTLDNYASDIAYLQKYVNFYTDKHYLSNNDTISYYGGTKSGIINLHLGLIENGVSNVVENVNYDVKDYFNSNKYWKNNYNSILTYTLNTTDPNGEQHNTSFNLLIKQPKTNHIYLNSNEIDLYYGNTAYLAIGNCSTNINKDTYSYLTLTNNPADESYYGNYNFYRYKSTSVLPTSEAHAKEYIGINSALTNSKIEYSNNTRDAFIAVNVDDNLGYTIVKTPITSSYSATRDELINVFNIKKHIKHTKDKESIFINRYIQKLIDRGIVYYNSIQDKYFYFKEKTTSRDTSVRYFSVDSNFYIDDFKIVNMQNNVSASEYIKNGPTNCTLLTLNNDNNVSKKCKLTMVHSKDSELNPTNSTCVINAHSINANLEFKNSNIAYSYYDYSNGVGSINVANNYIYKYNIDNEEQNVLILNSNNDFTITHNGNNVKLPKVTCSYTYDNIDFIEYPSDNFNITTNILPNSDITEYTVYNYKTITNATDYLYTYLTPLQKPTFTPVLYNENESYLHKFYPFCKITHFETNDDGQQIIGEDKLFYTLDGNITTVNTTYDSTDSSSYIMSTLSYYNCKFYDDAISNVMPIKIYNNAYIGVKYNFDWYNYDELNESNNIVDIDCKDLIYVKMLQIDNPQKYVVWENDINNISTYLTSGSYIYFTQNNSTFVDNENGINRVKTIYYTPKGSKDIFSFNTTYTSAPLRANTYVAKNNNYTLTYTINESKQTSLIEYSYVFTDINNNRYDLNIKNNINKLLTSTDENPSFTMYLSDDYKLDYRYENNTYHFVGDIKYKNLSNAIFTIDFVLPERIKNNVLNISEDYVYINDITTTSYYNIASTFRPETVQYLLTEPNYFNKYVNITSNPLIMAAGNEYTVENSILETNSYNNPYYKYYKFTYTMSCDTIPQIMSISSDLYCAYKGLISDLKNNVTDTIRNCASAALSNGGNYIYNVDSKHNDVYTLYKDAYLLINSSFDTHNLIKFDNEIGNENPTGQTNIIMCTYSFVKNNEEKILFLRTTLNTNDCMVNGPLTVITGRNEADEASYGYLGPMSLIKKVNPYVTYLDAFGIYK